MNATHRGGLVPVIEMVDADRSENWHAPHPNEFERAGIDESFAAQGDVPNMGYRVLQSRPSTPYREVRLSSDHETFFRRWAEDVRAEMKRAMRRRTFFPYISVEVL